MSFKDVRVVKLGTITKWTSGGTPLKNNLEFWNGSIPWISARNLKSNYIYNSETTITELGLQNGSRLAPVNSILLLVRGSGLFNDIPIGLVEKEVAFNQDLKCIQVDSDSVIPEYIFYWLLGNKQLLNGILEVTGIGAGKFDTKLLQNLDISLPSIEEQESIVSLCDSIYRKIEVNNQINKTLENMAGAIFKQWFIDFEFLNVDGEPYQSSGGEMVESELGMIPKGWEVKSILETDLIVSDFVANGSFKSLKENVNLYEEQNHAVFMRNTDLKCKFRSGMKFVDEHSYNFLNKTQLKGGEVIISNVGDVGSVYLCPYFDVPMTLGNNVIMLKSQNNPLLNIYFYRLFKSREGQGLIDSITGGSAQPKFNKTDFRNLSVVLPSKKIIESHLGIMNSIETIILSNDKENTSLIKIRDILLPKLMSGEIRVPFDSEIEI